MVEESQGVVLPSATHSKTEIQFMSDETTQSCCTYKFWICLYSGF
uniref:Uncharacterized protein n=1 Tax=Rhizophora mucronata TaxID=61149 RepID=A0A2P2Q7V7_RHIMU